MTAGNTVQMKLNAAVFCVTGALLLLVKTSFMTYTTHNRSHVSHDACKMQLKFHNSHSQAAIKIFNSVLDGSYW